MGRRDGYGRMGGLEWGQWGWDEDNGVGWRHGMGWGQWGWDGGMGTCWWGWQGGDQRGQDGVGRDGDSGVGTLGWGDRGLGLVGKGWTGPGRWGCPIATLWVLNLAAPAQVLQQAMLDATANTAAVVQEAVSSIETVRTFAGEEEEERRHSRAVAEMLGLKDRIDVERALFTLIQRVRRVQEGPWHLGTPVRPPHPLTPIPADATAGHAGAGPLLRAPAAP